MRSFGESHRMSKFFKFSKNVEDTKRTFNGARLKKICTADYKFTFHNKFDNLFCAFIALLVLDLPFII